GRGRARRLARAGRRARPPRRPRHGDEHRDRAPRAARARAPAGRARERHALERERPHRDVAPHALAEAPAQPARSALRAGRDPVAVAPIAELLAKEIPGARLTWLDELGHFPMLESPGRWATEALAFVEEIEKKKNGRERER